MFPKRYLAWPKPLIPKLKRAPQAAEFQWNSYAGSCTPSMRAATCCISHSGVLVAPQMPTVLAPANHSSSTSVSFSMK